jgi:Mlc titration factor MtfA (ptsG expression regulator)
MHLSERKKRENIGLSVLIIASIFAVFLIFIWKLKDSSPNVFYILVAIGLLSCFSIYVIFTKKIREREAMKNKPFPEEWRKILERYVAFYRALSAEEKDRFETEIQVFLHETRITGIKTEVDDVTMVLSAASAEIPVFSFPDWEYENLGEILIYPGPFSKDFRLEGPDRTVTGMVGTGIMQGIMILSKPALIGGFENTNDKGNVGIHEFVHLLDSADGSYDGIPNMFLDKAYLAPWLEVMHKETERIKDGDSKMNPYGATNKIEFFAVASEYFFEHPDALKKEKPELYELLTKIFKQDTKHRLGSAVKNLINYTGNKVSRNAACPCGSGKKYKNCCLKNSRSY